MPSLWSFGFVAAIGAATAGATPAAAGDEPYLAIRTGLACSQCHTNRTGGGQRNAFGVIYAQTRLPMTVAGYGQDGPFLAPRVADFLSLGADLRVRSSRRFTGTDPKNPIEIAEGNLYVEARVVPDVVSVYADQVLAPGTSRSRELFLLIGSLPANAYVKAGRFFPPYGLRLLDDSQYIRQRTGFNYANSDEGVELGLEPGPLSLAVAVTNGAQGAAENNSEKQVSGVASLVWSRLRVGASASRNDAPAGRREVIGAFGGLRLGRLALLGEYDFIFDDPGAEASAAFVEGDLLVGRGFNVKVTYGFLDPDRDIGENARTRLRFGIEPFITQFLQASVFYTLLEDIPQAQTDRDELTVELHGFF